MQHIFGEHIGPTVEAYVHDIVVKTKRVSNLINDLDVAFKCLRAKNIKLNPEKCVFGNPLGMLLGFIVSERGIEANPEKIAAITKMGPIHDLKGVQRVTGCIVALSRFIARLGENALPLYRLLKKSEHFSWTLEVEEALTKLKATLSNSPILVPPATGEPLLLYVAATTYLARLEASLLRQRGALRNQGSLPPNPKAIVRHHLDTAQTSSLLRGPPGDRGVFFPLERDSPKPSGLG
jgi:hypothetical protein